MSIIGSGKNVVYLSLAIVFAALILGGFYYVTKTSYKDKNFLAEETGTMVTAATSSDFSATREELEALKEEVSRLKKNDTERSVVNITEPIQEPKMEETENQESYDLDPQVNDVLNQIARVSCYLDEDELYSTGSGSVWTFDDEESDYYLVTNLHVLEEVYDEGGWCQISIALDYPAIMTDVEQAYKDGNLLIYGLDPTYFFWETDGFDFAVVKITEIEQSIHNLDEVAMVTNPSVCNTNVVINSKVKIIGFPYIGTGWLPTITEGIVSSYETIGERNYYLTSAKIEQGNSGGIAVTDDFRCFIGIPTLVVVGGVESLGRILMINEQELLPFLSEAAKKY